LHQQSATALQTIAAAYEARARDPFGRHDILQGMHESVLRTGSLRMRAGVRLDLGGDVGAARQFRGKWLMKG